MIHYPKYLNNKVNLMKKYLFLLFISTLFTACMSSVDQNEEGFLYNSWSGENKDETVYKGGTYTHGYYDQMYAHTLETQSKEITAEVLSSNGLNVGIKLSINWVNKPNTVKQHYRTYNLDGEGRFIDPTVYGSIKDVIGKYVPEEIYSTKREQIEAEIYNKVNSKFEESNLFELKMLEVLDVNLPATITKAIEAKVRQEQITLEEEQKAKTKEAQGLSIVAEAKAQGLSIVAEAEARKEAAIQDAEANKILSASITDNILEQKKLELEKLKIEKWNGEYPHVIAGENANFLLDVGTGK